MEHPVSEWAAGQLLEAFTWDSVRRYLLRDRDGSYGEKFEKFGEAVDWLGIPVEIPQVGGLHHRYERIAA